MMIVGMTQENAMRHMGVFAMKVMQMAAYATMKVTMVTNTK